ncbi:uncharacterized protein LOC132749584 [Ruditapes philippinarum]|uniref:uncharacterized protein LOC132749584 n=1 Tax=Ruditapes philippinarum TaxID=129788 RepID=UPI00295BD07D|nr:uncharacterized protein LOC132749584 [Ruditapes philippinarum]
MLTKLQSKPEKKFSQLETIPSHTEEAEEDDYLKHFCRKKLKLLKKKKLASEADDESEDDISGESVTSSSTQHRLLSDYGLPDSVLERAKITNILSAMKRAAKEEIHDPRKCRECRDMKSQLDEEDARRQFVTAHAKRLKNKLMDAKVEEHMLKMNSVSMIAELARTLPRSSEKPEKIFDQLFEPLLGKNVMR